MAGRRVNEGWVGDGGVMTQFRWLQAELQRQGHGPVLQDGVWSNFRREVARSGRGRPDLMDGAARPAGPPDEQITANLFLYFRNETARQEALTLHNELHGLLRRPERVTASRLRLEPYLGREIPMDSNDYFDVVAILQDLGNYEAVNQIWNLHSKLTYIRLTLSGTVPPPSAAAPGGLPDEPLGAAPNCVSHPYIGARFADGRITHGQLTELADGEPDCLGRTLLNTWATPDSLAALDNRARLDWGTLASSGRLSLKAAEPVLARFGLRASAIDVRNQPVWSVGEPNSRAGLWLLVHNSHVFVADRDVNSLRHRRLRPLEDHAAGAPVVDFPSVVTIKTRHYVRDLAGLLALLQTTQGSEGMELQIQYGGDLMDLFRDFRTRLGYEPEIHVVGKQVGRLTLHLQNTYRIVDFPADNPDEGRMAVPEAFGRAAGRLFDALLHPFCRSEYSPGLMVAWEALPKAQLHRRLLAAAPDTAIGLDIVRAYTSNLMDLDRLPVFCALDDWEPYAPGAALEPYALYLVRNDAPGSVESWFIANRRWSLVSGMVLAGAEVPGLTPVAMIRPAHLAANGAPDVIRALYADPDLDSTTRKLAVNVAVGYCNKKYATRESAIWTTSVSEAYHFSADIQATDEGEFLSIRQSQKKPLRNGYLPIGFMVFDLMRLKMLRFYRDLVAAGVRVYGIATDCFLVDRVPAWEFRATKTVDDFGRYHIEGEKRVPALMWGVENNDFEVPWSRPGPSRVSELAPGTIVTSLLPGSGKTWTLATRFPGALFLTNSNDQRLRLEDEYGVKAMTLCSFLNFKVTNEGLARGKLPIHVKTPDVLVVDEICQQSLFLLQHFVRWAEAHPAVQLYATGDRHQTCGIDAWNQVAGRRRQYLRCLSRVFPFELRLPMSACGRIKDAGQLEKLKAIHRDLFRERRSPMDVVRRHGLQVTDNPAQTQHCLTLSNLTAALLNQARLGAECPKEMVAKTYHANLVLNRTYPVLGQTDKHYVLEHGAFLKSYFRPPWCLTVHGLQGGTLDLPYTVFDATSPYASREWFWVALTRTSDLNSVWVYTGPRLGQASLRIGARLAAYPLLTRAWVLATLKEQNYCCGVCSTALDLGSRGPEDWSIDRQFNSNPDHLPSNCWITHTRCNVSTH